MNLWVISRLAGNILLRIGRGPADAVFDEGNELRITPGALVVSPGRVEHAPFADFAHPRVGFVVFIVAPFGEHDAIGIVHGVDIGFVPAFDGREAFHGGMLTLYERLFENTGAVRLELRADKLDVFGRVQKTVARTVNGHETMTALDVLQRRLFLLASDA